jgi:hypothetical protein
MLEKDTVILLVDTDGILNLPDLTVEGWKVGIEVIDRSFAVTPKSEAIRQVASAIFAQIKGMLALVRKLWIPTELSSYHGQLIFPHY